MPSRDSNPGGGSDALGATRESNPPRRPSPGNQLHGTARNLTPTMEYRAPYEPGLLIAGPE